MTGARLAGEKRIVVASSNPVKLRAALHGFMRLFADGAFTVQAVSAPSGVSVQPVSDHETLRGALNRVENARRAQPEADYWVGIEGGVEPDGDDLLAFAWVVVSDGARVSKGRSAAFVLPPRVAALVRTGLELGEADDIVFGRENSKQENGAIGLLTGDVIDRAALYEMAVIMALLPLRNPGLYS